MAIEALFRAIDSKLNLPILSPSAMQRQEWSRRFVMVMVERGINVEQNFGPYFDWSRYEPHSSPVIESIHVHYGHMMDDPHIYFAALYLAKLEAAKELDIPYVVKQCIDSILLGAERQRRAADAKKTKKEK